MAGAAPRTRARGNKPAAEERPALTWAQLAKAALAKGDIKGYEVAETPADEMPAESVPATPAACQPLADMLLFTSAPKAKARTGRTLTSTDALSGTVTSLAFLAHEQSDAEKVIAGLRTASKSCTSYEHTDYKYSGVKPLTAPDKGDEAVSCKLKGVIDGTSVPMTFTVVRSGSTVARSTR